MADDKAPKSPELDAAQIRKTQAEAAVSELELELKRIEVQSEALKLRQDQRESDDFDAMDAQNRVYRFNEDVSASSVRSAIATLSAWGRRGLGTPIQVVYCSPGGSVFHGLALGACLDSLVRDGHEVITRIEGYSASMAGILAQFGTRRQIAHDSYLHLHEVSAGAIGKASDLEDGAALAKRLTKHACEIYARRCGGSMTAKEIHDRIKRQEWWLSAAEAKDLGFVDEIV